MSKFGVLGSGLVGQTLASGLRDKGYEVKIGSRNAGKLAGFTKSTGIANGAFADVARWAEHLVLAVKGTAAVAAVAEAGPTQLARKLVIDTTNPISDEPPDDGVVRYFTSPNASLMEQLQSTYPDVHFVKAFNSVGAALMVNPRFPVRPTMFYCGNDASAKAITRRVIEQFGWDGADMGTVRAARALEPLCQLWCIPGFRENHWADHAFHLLQL
jgi:8-hydroxy-5-deazaflavin:NADPH oxidoreductase